MMDLYQVGICKAVIVNVVEYGSMCEEFDPGPGDDPFPQYYNCSVAVHLMDSQKQVVTKLGAKEMREQYKNIEGKRDRISYYYIMKYLDHCERELRLVRELKKLKSKMD